MNNKFRTLFLLALLAFSIQSQAQIEKGKWSTGLNLSFQGNKYHSDPAHRDYNTNSSTIGASVGNFITKNWLVGLGVSYGRDYNKDAFASDSYSTRTSTTYGGDLYIQYFKNIEGKFYYIPYINFSYDWNKLVFKSKSPGFTETSNDDKSQQQVVSLVPLRFGYLLKNRFLFQAGFGSLEYGHSHSTSEVPNSDAEGSSNGFNISLSPNISNIGISFIF